MWKMLIGESNRRALCIEQVCQQADQREQEHPEHQLHSLGAPDQQEEPVEEEGHEADVDQIEDVTPDVPALEEHQDVAQDHVHFGD